MLNLIIWSHGVGQESSVIKMSRNPDACTRNSLSTPEHRRVTRRHSARRLAKERGFVESLVYLMTTTP